MEDIPISLDRHQQSRGDKKIRINRYIKVREVRLIDAEGEQAGIVETSDALSRAEAAGLDLVEISPTASPPVCRIMDYGKYLFELGKRQKKKVKQTLHVVKELKFRPVTEIGDYNVKLRKAIDFLKTGNKVKFTVRFRGREVTYQDSGTEILRRLESDLQAYGAVEQQPRLEGKQMSMLVVPLKK